MKAKLDINNLDKTGWKKFRFEEIAQKISETVDPNTTELKTYVGLEHIDPEDIHIKRFGTPEDVSGGKLKCYPGDVIFGKRRAYQRKAAIVHFEGICSAHAFVFRANPKVINPKLFPFFLHSNQFMHRAVDISVGGLSPTINWGDLKHQEFFIPPKEEQAKLAELLWAMDEVIEKEKYLKQKLETSWYSEIEMLIHGININGKTINEVLNELEKKQEVISLSKLGEFLKGKGIAKSEVVEKGYPCIRYGELYTRHNRIIRSYFSFINEKSKNESFQLKKHDLLIAGSGETITEIGKSASFVDDIEAYAGSDTLVFRPFDMDGYYLGYLMNCQLVRQQMNKYGTGATVMHIYNSDLKLIKVPKHTRKEQESISKKLETFSSNQKILEGTISNSQSLQKSLINQIF